MLLVVIRGTEYKVCVDTNKYFLYIRIKVQGITQTNSLRLTAAWTCTATLDNTQSETLLFHHLFFFSYSKENDGHNGNNKHWRLLTFIVFALS